MELVFKESEQVLSDKPAYEVEFEASSDFNIHIERPSDGYFLIFQKSISNGKYAEVNSVYDLESKTTIDIDFVGAVYPKWIKIVSEVEPTMAVATSDGEIKVVEEKEKFSIRLYTWGTSATNVTPTDTVAEYEIPKKDATWQDVIDANSDFTEERSSLVYWKNDHMVSSGFKSMDNMGDVKSSDKVIAGYEYSAIEG